MNGKRLRGRSAAIVAARVAALSVVVGGYSASPAFAASSAGLQGTPCTADVRVCVDLDHQTAWLAQNGKITLGPIRISSGGQGEETPQGTFTVLSKDKDHVSREFPLSNGQGAPMPNAVFFEPGGIAFHCGEPKRASAGCIHVPPPDDATFFNTLNVGDKVELVKKLSGNKGGFYKVNHVQPPSKKERAAIEAKRTAARKNAARINASPKPND